MKCEDVREQIVLAAYGELPDELAPGLEQHLTQCEACFEELAALRRMDEMLTIHPVAEPDPNLLAQSRMRLDEALDAMPPRGPMMRLRANALAWLGHLQGAPALATLLVGIGFLGGNFTYRYQVAHAPKPAPTVVLSNTTGGGVATISGVLRLPDDRVQVSYDRVVPEMAQGALSDPQIRRLLMLGARSAATNDVRVDAVALLSNACRTGFACRSETDESGLRAALVASLRTDRNPGVRLKALDGLEPYVSNDERVRDAVAQALMGDPSTEVRTRAVALLEPVQGDSSVRQALRTVSTTDVNPYLRTVSTQALAGSSSIQ